MAEVQVGGKQYQRPNPFMITVLSLCAGVMALGGCASSQNRDGPANGNNGGLWGFLAKDSGNNGPNSSYYSRHEVGIGPVTTSSGQVTMGGDGKERGGFGINGVDKPAGDVDKDLNRDIQKINRDARDATSGTIDSEGVRLNKDKNKKRAVRRDDRDR